MEARREGRHDDCAAAMRRAVALAPHDLFSHAELGGCLKAAGDVRGALVAYRRAQASHPTYAPLRRLKQWITAAERLVRKQDEQREGGSE